MEMRLDTQVIKKRESFKYLRFIIQEYKQIDDDVTY